jgi:hypothetical protein
LKITADDTSHEDERKDTQMAVLKLRWLIEYLVKQIRFKSKMKEMMNPLTEISLSSQSKEAVLKKLCHLKAMVKHCEISQIAPLLSDIVLLAIVNDPN